MTIPRNLSFLAQGASASGVLSVPYGGTGVTSFTAGYIPYGNGTGALSSSSNLDFSGSNLGINVTPVYPLHVANPASSYLDTFAVFNELGTWNANGGLVLANYYASTTLIAGIKFNSLTTTTGDISFHTGGKTERMRIGVTGGVSIGNTTDPGAGNLNVNGTIKTGGYTVAGLPTGVTGARAYVTDALAPTFGSIVVGGGSVTIPVFYNGTNWICA